MLHRLSSSQLMRGIRGTAAGASQYIMRDAPNAVTPRPAAELSSHATRLALTLLAVTVGAAGHACIFHLHGMTPSVDGMSYKFQLGSAGTHAAGRAPAGRGVLPGSAASQYIPSRLQLPRRGCCSGVLGPPRHRAAVARKWCRCTIRGHVPRAARAVDRAHRPGGRRGDLRRPGRRR